MGADGTTTIKYAESNKDYDAPWNVFNGSVAERRADLIEAFGWDAAEVEGQTLSQLTVKASAQAKAEYKLRNDLGATVISTAKAAEPTPAGATVSTSLPPQDGGAGDPWEDAARATAAAGPPPGAGEAPAEAQPMTLLDKVLACETRRQVKLLWRDNKDRWSEVAEQAKAHAATLPES